MQEVEIWDQAVCGELFNDLKEAIFYEVPSS
jgi:hypothetical protein